MIKQPRQVNAIQLLCLVMCLVWIVALAGFLYYSQLKIKALSADNDYFERSIEIAEQDIFKMDELLERYRQEILAFEKVLFNQADVSLFLENLSASSTKYNIAIRNIQVMDTIAVGASSGKDEDNKEASLWAVPFRFQISGNLFNVLDFMSSIENSPQLLTISDVRLSASGHPQVQGSFRLDLYSLSKFAKD